MSLHDELRDQAQRILDGMTVNREQFARRVLNMLALNETAMRRISDLEREAAQRQGLLNQYDARIKALQAKLDNPFGSMFGSKS